LVPAIERNAAAKIGAVSQTTGSAFRRTTPTTTLTSHLLEILAATGKAITTGFVASSC